MSYFSISAKMISKNDNIYTYAYALDDLEVKEENSGVFTIKENLFYSLPIESKFLSNEIAGHVLNGDIVQIKPLPNAKLLGDGFDPYIIYIVDLLIQEKARLDSIPEKFGFMNGKKIIECLSDPDVASNLIEKGIFEQEHIDKLIQKIKDSEPIKRNSTPTE